MINPVIDMLAKAKRDPYGNRLREITDALTYGNTPEAMGPIPKSQLINMPPMPPAVMPPIPDLGDPNDNPMLNEDPRGMFFDLDSRMNAPGNSFVGQPVQVAGPVTAEMIEGAGETPAFGGDSVQSRALANDEIAYRDAMNGLSGILERIQGNPELLETTHTLRGRAETGLLRLRDRLGIDAIDIGPEGEETLGDAAAYRQEVLTRVNQYIKDITGAQVGQGDETRRLMQVQVNESDSPTQVAAKINNALNLARLDIVRRRLMRRTDGEAPSDREVRGFLKERGAELYNQALQEGLSPAEARLRAAEMMSEEFGW